MSDHSKVVLLPNSAWEAYLADLNDLLPGQFAAYHTGSDTQRKLLKLSVAEPAELPDFLCKTLLPAVQEHGDIKWEPLVLKALTDLAAHPDVPFAMDKLFISGAWHPIKSLVDSSSKTMRLLWDRAGDLERSQALFTSTQHLQLI